MSAKQVLFRSEAREKILRGATHLAEAVRITLGPKFKSVRNVTAGASAIDIKRGLDRGPEAIAKSLKALARPVSSRK